MNSKVSKRYKVASEKVKEDFYLLDDAVKVLKENSTAKFDETFEIAFNLGVDPKHADQMVRGVTSLPNGTGKKVKVAVFAKGTKAEEASEAGADLVGDDGLIEDVKGGKIDFDRCIATPDMMSSLGKVARVLGPKGLMPNPKLGTVTTDISKAVKSAKDGQVEYRVDKNGILQAGIGKVSFDEKAIKENILSFVAAISQSKPSGVKGTYIKKISISSSMGPGIRLDISDILEKIA